MRVKKSGIKTDTMYYVEQNDRTISLIGCNTSLDELSSLAETLNRKLKKAAEFEINTIDWTKPRLVEEERDLKNFLHKCYQITVTLVFYDGGLVESEDTSILHRKYSRKIRKIIIGSVAAHNRRRENVRPRNSFVLELDFEESPILDWRYAASAPTLNQSAIRIVAEDQGWAEEISAEIREFLNRSKLRWIFLHKSFAYDAFLWLFGVPSAFAILYPISKLISQINLAFSVVLCIVLFLGLLIFVRLLFAYGRWLFPAAILQENQANSTLQRVMWFSVVIACVANLMSALLLRYL